MYKLKEQDVATLHSPAEEWVFPGCGNRAGGKRVCCGFRSCGDTSRIPTTVMTANGEVQTREEATEDIKELDLFVTVMLLEETPAVLSLGKLCEDHGFSYRWTSGQKPHLTKNGKRTDCNFSHWCHSWSLVYRRIPPQRPHLHHHLHHRIPYLTKADTPKIQYPKEVAVRVRSYGKTRCIDQRKPITQIKKGRVEVQRDLLHDLPDWLREFRENLVDESSPVEPCGNPAP